jgi:hypothetical protein
MYNLKENYERMNTGVVEVDQSLRSGSWAPSRGWKSSGRATSRIKKRHVGAENSLAQRIEAVL